MRKERNKDEILKMLEEDKKRIYEYEANYNPITGENADIFDDETGESLYKRKKVVIKDHIIPEQWLPFEAMNNVLVQQVIENKTIENYIKNNLNTEPTKELKEEVQKALLAVRRKTDPIFWFYVYWRIKDKKGSEDIIDLDENAEDIEQEEQNENIHRRASSIKLNKKKRVYSLIPFKLNYPQLKTLAKFEKRRFERKPCSLIIVKARQWGGSTVTQSYFAWIQLELKVSWNSVIVAQVSSTAKKIKMMYEKAISQYEPELLGIKDQNAQLRFSPYGDSKTDFQITYGSATRALIARDAVVSIATYNNPNSVPGSDIALVHYSEVALWKKTEGHEPEDVIKSITGGLIKAPLTMEVLESTPRGSGNFFQREYDASKNGESSRDNLFIPWYYILNDTKEVRNKYNFARWILDNKDNDEFPHNIPEHNGVRCLNSGKYIYRLWTLGATLEGIMWYILRRLEFHRQSDMASEAPTDDIEAFTSSENLAFDLYDIEQMKELYAKAPTYVGDIFSDYSSREKCLKSYEFTERVDGKMYIWEKPVKDGLIDRYLVVVDIGGIWRGADWSVIRVFDRSDLINGGMEKTVLMWNGHIPHDHLGWKAVQVAKWYNNALLVFESNTLESKDQNREVEEGDQMTYILSAINYCYDNLYVRSQRMPDDLDRKRITKFGFSTNRKTKPDIVNLLMEVIREHDYVERDAETLAEFATYERKPDGSYGSMVGKKDDRLMTAGIGLLISRTQMDKPHYKISKKIKKEFNSRNLISSF